MKKVVFVLLAMMMFLPLTGKTDGIVEPDEYENTRELRKGTLYWESDGEKLFIAYTAPGEGWVALGFGSKRMDGTLMILGYAKEGKSTVSLERGRGKRHSPTDEKIDFEAVAFEKDGETTLEVAIALSDFPTRGESGSDHIIAYGRRDNLTSIHRYRDAQSIKY